MGANCEKDFRTHGLLQPGDGGDEGGVEAEEEAGLAQTLSGPPVSQHSVAQGPEWKVPAGLKGVKNWPRGLMKLKRTFA